MSSTGVVVRGDVAEGGEVRGPGVDAAVILTAYVWLLWFVPSPMVVPALGSAGSPAALLALIVFVWWTWFVVRRIEPSDAHPRPVRVSVLGWLLAMVVVYAHAMAGPLPGNEISVADSGLLRLIGFAGIVLLATDGISTLARHMAVLRRLAFAAGVVALLGLVQYASGELYVDRIRIPGLVAGTSEWTLGTRSGFARPSGTSTSPIEYGVVLGMMLPLVIVCASGQSRHRWVYRGMLVAVIASIFFSMSRSAYLCAVAGTVTLALSWDLRKQLRASAFLAVVSTTLYISVPGLLGSIRGLFSNAGQDPSIASRTGSYEIAWEFISSSPVVGRGFGTFLPRYWILDNAYLALLIEAGVVGLAALLVLVVTALASVRRARDTLADGEERQLAQAVLASTVAGACGLAFFDAFAFPQTAGCFFLMIGMAGSLRRLTRDRPSEPVGPRAGA